MTQAHILQRPSMRACNILTPIAVSMLGIALVFPDTLPIPSLVTIGGMLALFAWISWNDFKTRRVPNSITYPLMAIGIARAIAFGDVSFLLYWAVFFFLWTARFMGGGDAKLLMGLFGLFPNFQLAQVMSASILVTGLPYLLYKYRRQWRTVLRALFWRLITGQLFPSHAEFDKEAVPFAFSFCLGCGVYFLMRVVQW